MSVSGTGSRRECQFRRLGCAALLAVMLSACAALPSLETREPSYALADTADTDLARQAAPRLAAHPGLSGFRTLASGENAFLARYGLIGAAQKSIDAQYYIWHDDLTGRALHQHLLAAADRGVRVRLLLDDLDTMGKDRLLRTLDAHPNIEIRLFNPFANRGSRGLDFVGDTRRINRRMHNKTLTVDNTATIFGGRNIGDEYFAANAEVAFGDMDALAVGPIAQEVSAQFDLYWNSAWAYPITAFAWDEPVGEAELAAYRTQAQADIEAAKASEYAAYLPQFELAQATSLADIDFVWSEWLLAYDQPDKVQAQAVDEETHLAPKLRMGAEQTQRDLIIVSPYFVPGDEVTGFLTGLVGRGVRVRILTNSLQANDVSLVHAGYMRYRKPLVAGGVELYEYRATPESRPERGQAHIGASRASLHAKFFGFDQTRLFIGSFNLDGRSAALNTELGAYYNSPAEARELSEKFDSWAAKFAYRVELDDNGKLVWLGELDGRQERLTHEPDTTWWKRFSTRLLSWIVPESQL